MRWDEHETTVTRSAFFEELAPGLVAAAIGQLPKWSGPAKLSEQFAFFCDDEVLAIASWPGATQGSADEALAWALALGGDRDVVLLLPESREAPTLQRLPWVTSPVRVFRFGSVDPTEVASVVIPAKAEVLAQVKGWGTRGSATAAGHLGADRAPWIQDLVAWIDTHAGLDPRHRPSYLAWHTAGRQVLKIARTRSGLRLHVGVRYTKPKVGQPTPLPEFEIKSPLTPQQSAEVNSTIDEAMARRLTGADSGHEEHRLQHALDAKFTAEGELLGLNRLHREFAAWRPGRSPAFIDFLGATSAGVPHVVEVKLGNDVMLVLQGLDYWIWATANPEILASQLAVKHGVAPLIDFVVGAVKTSKAVGPYTLRQLEALDGEIGWRFHVATNWTGTLAVNTLPARSVPGPPTGWEPATPPRYAQHLQRHLVSAHSSLLVGKGPFLRSPTGGLVAEAHAAHSDLQTRGLLHPYSHHVRSSQAFALNLFAGLNHTTRCAIADLVGLDDIEITSEVMFEFEDDTDQLHEATAASPHRTQVDAAMQCTSAGGLRTLLLIEVKLSEIDFGHCSAYQSAINDTRDVCRVDGPFGNDPTNCFQLRNHNREHRRTYDIQLGSTPSTGNGCSFRLGASQPMRNVALGRALISRGFTDRVVHALAAPKANLAIWRRWKEAKNALIDVGSVRLADLPADALLELYETERSNHLVNTYQLGDSSS